MVFIIFFLQLIRQKETPFLIHSSSSIGAFFKNSTDKKIQMAYKIAKENGFLRSYSLSDMATITASGVAIIMGMSNFFAILN